MKNVLLDLGGVVFNSSGQSNEQIDWSIISKLNNKYGHDLNIGKIDVMPFLNEYNLLTRQKLDIENFLKNVFDTLEFNEELVHFLSSQSNIYILSDNYRENIEYISQRYNFKKWSTKQIYSFEYGLTKYEGSAFFEQVLDTLGYNPSEVIFIDDSPQKIQNARKTGIRSILFKNNEQLFEAYSKL